MMNVEGSPNIQMNEGALLFLSSFGFLHYFVIRHSSFVISP